MSLTLEGPIADVVQAIFKAQLGTQLLTLKALVDRGIVSGDALLEAMAQMADDMGDSSGQIINFMAQNIEAHINHMNPAPFELTVIDGGKTD